MAEILEVKEEHEDELLELENCVSVGVGKKEVGGMETDEDAIIVGVKEKVPEEELDKGQIVPPEIEGFMTDVQEVGIVTAPPNVEHEEMPKKGKSRKDKWRPVPEGVSTAHEDVTAGTSSFILVDDEGNEFPSSNNHVIANMNKGEKGDPILQPGPADGGKLPDDKCGELEDFVKVEDGVKVDLGWEKSTVEFENKLLGLGVPKGPIRKVKVGDELRAKTGRTTQVTRGKVKQAHATVKVRYGELGVITFEDQILTEKMLSPGDSGSPAAYEDDGKERPAALGFAGSDRVSVFNRIENVEKESGMKVKTEEGPPAPPNRFYGHVFINDKPASKGTLVEVEKKDSSWQGSVKTGSGEDWDDNYYDINVPAGEGAPSEPAGTAVFYVKGIKAAEHEIVSGEVTELNLRVEERPTAEVTLTLEKKAEKEGRIRAEVQDSEGNPLIKSTVSIEGPVDRKKSTGDDNVAVFEPVPIGSYTVTGSKSGYESDSKEISEEDFTSSEGKL